MVALTPEQFEHFIRVMIIVALLGGLVGAVIWDLIQASGLGAVSGIGYLFDRHRRIKAARSRAADEFFASGTAAVDSPSIDDFLQWLREAEQHARCAIELPASEITSGDPGLHYEGCGIALARIDAATGLVMSFKLAQSHG